MVNRPPQVVTIDLEERDVKEDMAKVVNAMSRIRAETIQDRNITDEKKDEYLHLSFRLASGIEAVADELMVQRMQAVAEAMNKNPALLNYDPIQDGYWKRESPRFVETLDDILISVVRDDFHSLDAKQHVLQAVKYLGLKDEPFNEREKVYGTILPFQKAVSPPKDGFLKRASSFLLGRTSHVNAIDDLVLEVKGNTSDSLDEIVQRAKDMGYTSVQIGIPQGSEEELRKLYPGLQLLGVDDSDDVEGDESSESSKSSIGRKIVARLFKATIPISYPLAGLLPYSLNRRLVHYMQPEFNISSNNQGGMYVAGLFSELGLGIWGGVHIANKTGSTAYGWLAGGLIGADVISRFIMSMQGKRDEYNEEIIYSPLPMKLALWPLESILDDRDPANYVQAEIPLQKNPASREISNPLGFYDPIGKLEVPLEAETSLQWNLQNHHSFGKRFRDYVAAETKKNKHGLKIDKETDREHGSVIYDHQLPVGDYTKQSSLFCFAGGNRYVVTTVARGKAKDGILLSTSRILAQNVPLDDRIKQIGEQSDARYVHVIKYQGGKIVEDMEGSK